MKINRLEVKGFKSLKDVVWKPGDLNIIIGENASGKSNLIQLLELLSTSAKGGLSKAIKSLGGMEPVVWNGAAKEIIIGLKTTPIDDDPLQYELQLSRFGTTGSYNITHESLVNFENYTKGKKNPTRIPQKCFLRRTEKDATIFDDVGAFFQTPLEDFPEDETVLSVVRAPFAQNRHIHLFRERLSSFDIFHNFDTSFNSPIRLGVVTSYENCLNIDGSNLTNVLNTLYNNERDFKNNIDDAMKAAFGDEYDRLVFPPVAEQRLQLAVSWKSLKRPQSAAVLSDGTLRFLLLLAILGNPPPSSVIAIDEPETGLHPSMLPIIAEFAVEASKHSQIIFTTHSVQFLDAFKNHQPTTTVTKWENGETLLKTIDKKDLEYWLKEYTLGKLFQSGELEEMV